MLPLPLPTSHQTLLLGQITTITTFTKSLLYNHPISLMTLFLQPLKQPLALQLLPPLPQNTTIATNYNYHHKTIHHIKILIITVANVIASILIITVAIIITIAMLTVVTEETKNLEDKESMDEEEQNPCGHKQQLLCTCFLSWGGVISSYS